MLKKWVIFFLFPLIMISCKTYRTYVPIQGIKVSFDGGNNYEKASNIGNIEIRIQKNNAPNGGPEITSKFDAYSPIKRPVILTITEKNNLVLLSDQMGKAFILGEIDSTEKNCNYDCKINYIKTDKVSFKSAVAIFPYWHGWHILSGQPLFMRYHYYTLKVQKSNGKMLKMEWKYSVYKIKNNGKPYIWSGDYCEDKGGGLTKLKIK